MPIYKTGKKDKDGKSQYRVTYNYTDAAGNYKQNQSWFTVRPKRSKLRQN